MTGRILILDNSTASREGLAARLARAFFTILPSGENEEPAQLARAWAPDLVLVSLLSEGGLSPATIVTLRTDPATRLLPVIALVQDGDAELRVAALAAGADDVFPPSVDDTLLLARIHSLLRARDEATLVASALDRGGAALLALAESAAEYEPAPRIVLVATRPEVARDWMRLVSKRIGDRMEVFTHAEALALAEASTGNAPDVMVIEAGNAGESPGIRLMTRLSAHGAFRRSAFCIITTDGDTATAAAALEFGADDTVSPHRMAAEFDLRLHALLRRKQHKDRLRRLMERELHFAVTDPLTGVHNRRYAQPRLAGIARQAADEGSRFAVMVIDLDRFKSVNDRYGHAAGDAVLVEVSRRLGAHLRVTDLLARIGGEEFLVALPRTSLDEAQEVAERLRAAICETPVQLPEGRRIRVTASIGVAVGPGTMNSDGRNLMEQADRALLSAKLGGRNLVACSTCAA